MPVNVLVIDDQPVVLAGLAVAFRHRPFQVRTAGLRNARQAISDIRPQVILTESRVNGEDALELLGGPERKAYPNIALVYSEFDNPTFIARGVVLGASDYILKSCTIPELVESVRNAMARREPPPDSLFGQMKSYLRQIPPVNKSLPEMTSREYQVLRHLGFGLCNREIAWSLGISVETVKEHVQNILRKLNALDRTHAAVLAIRAGVA
jgi:DNA-binding NarL/FixJ family response regulator